MDHRHGSQGIPRMGEMSETPRYGYNRLHHPTTSHLLVVFWGAPCLTEKPTAASAAITTQNPTFVQGWQITTKSGAYEKYFLVYLTVYTRCRMGALNLGYEKSNGFGKPGGHDARCLSLHVLISSFSSLFALARDVDSSGTNNFRCQNLCHCDDGRVQIRVHRVYPR